MVNLNVDPENIYHGKIKFLSPKLKISEVVKELRVKKNFLIVKQKTWNDRELANNFLNYQNDVDCLLLGSSQIRNISVELNPKALNKMCNSLINLGLNGASIEDYLSTFNKIRLQNIKNKKIIVAIHPWTFKFNTDSRWIYNKKDFYEFLDFIAQKENSTFITENPYPKNDNFFKILKNLINFQYFNAAIKKIISGNKNLVSYKNKSEIKTEDFTNEIIFYDGSLYLEQPKKKIFLKTFINYKIIKNYYYDPNVVEILKKSIREISKENKIIFLLTPYHPDVWELKNEPIYNAMISTEKIARKLAKEEDLELLGSFNPLNLGCKSNEFHNLSHPSKWCLSRIKN